ncbi:hypothetical protein [Streptomyces sp. NPDC055058]
MDGRSEPAGAGQAVVLPAGSVRRLTAAGGPAHAMVAMAAGGRAVLPGGQERIPLPCAG